MAPQTRVSNYEHAPTVEALVERVMTVIAVQNALIDCVQEIGRQGQADDPARRQACADDIPHLGHRDSDWRARSSDDDCASCP